MSWYSKKNTIQYMASLATENPQFDSTLSGGITSRLSVSGKEAVMEILTTDHFTQLIVSCKHRNQFFLWRYNLNGFINAEWRTTASRSVKLPSIHFQPSTAKHVWARLTPTLGQVPPSSKKRFFRRLRLSENQSAEPDKYFFSVCRSSHSWRPHDITGQRCRFLYLWMSPEENGLPWSRGPGNGGRHGCTHARLCACGESRTGGRQPTLLTIPVKGPMGRIWGVGGSPGQKAEWLNKKRVKRAKAPLTVLSAPSWRGGGKPPPPKCEKGAEEQPASVPWVMLPLSLNAISSTSWCACHM